MTFADVSLTENVSAPPARGGKKANKKIGTGFKHEKRSVYNTIQTHCNNETKRYK